MRDHDVRQQPPELETEPDPRTGRPVGFDNGTLDTAPSSTRQPATKLVWAVAALVLVLAIVAVVF